MSRRGVSVAALSTLLVLATALPAAAQRGGGGAGDWIHKLSGPGLKGFAFTVFEVCVPGFLVGGRWGDCADRIRQKGHDARQRATESLAETRDVFDAFLPSDGPFSDWLEDAPAGSPLAFRALSSEESGALGARVAAVEQAAARLADFSRELSALAARITEGERPEGRKPGFLRRDALEVRWRSDRMAELVTLVLASTTTTVQATELAEASQRVVFLAQVVDQALSAEVPSELTARVVHTFLRLYSGTSWGSAAEQGGSDDITRFHVSPTISFELEAAGWATLYTESAVTAHRFSGRDFASFWRHSYDAGWGVRIDPSSTLPVFVDLGVRLRYFPTAFVDQDFGGPVMGEVSGGEWAWGPVVALGWHTVRLPR